ncbi:MAG: acyltransferase family protein [Terricaulis sp.]
MRAPAPIDALANGRGLRLDIQGLRAVAVVSVVLYHANANWLPGGFVGVDIFFVISGYLIAGILLGEMERGAYSLSGFYERRVRRLFPALFAMLATVLVVAAFTYAPDAYKELGKATLATLFFVSNFLFESLSGYFDADSQFRPLLHTWSLAVEEQFYLLFPLFLYAVVKFARRWMRAILVVVAVASLAACVWALPHHAAKAFYLAPFRGYELLIGAALAGLPYPARAPAWTRDALSAAGLVLIAGALFLLNRETPFPGFAALPPCLGAAAVIYAGVGAQSLGGQLISGRAFGFFGALSYSLYLWHWPVFVLGESILLHAPAPWQSALFIAISVALATLSWRYIEQPFLKRGHKWRVLTIGAGAMAAGAAVSLALIGFHGLPGRFDRESLQLFAAKNDFSAHRWSCHDFLGDHVRAYADNCVLGDASTPPHVAVWSDSHGVELASALAERLAAQQQSLLQLTASGCPPSLDYSRFDEPGCAAHNALIFPALRDDARIQTVVVATNYMSYPHKDWARIFAGEAEVLAQLAAHGKHIILIYPIPVFDYDAPTTLGILHANSQPLSNAGIGRRVFDAQVAEGRAFLDRQRAVLRADAVYPEAVFCDANTCHSYLAGAGALYFNRDHISETAARLLAARVPLGAH